MDTVAAALLLVLGVVSTRAAPLIRAPWGALQGIDVEGDGGRKMNAYLAIPYAEPPVGDLRFERPRPHPGPGTGEVFVADRLMPACIQPPLMVGLSRELSEDCLMLDVYTPASTDSQDPLAVMVFIHGGGFTYGDAYSYRPSKLVVDGQVIVVVIQYRLGLFGFFSTGDGTVKGNMGLWDQNLAIRWVKDNIRAFGGDPTRITIFGESAGSMSVGLQTLSPQSKGLFQRGILQSGAPGSFVDIVSSSDVEGAFKELADMMGCQGGSSEALVSCLKEQKGEEMFKESLVFARNSPLGCFYFPTVDGEFLPRSPEELTEDEDYLKENGIDKVDLIIGANNNEGSLVLHSLVILNMSPDSLRTAELFQAMVDFCIAYKGLENNQVVKKTLEFFYRGADSGSDMSQTADPVVNMYGDCLLTSDVVDWANRLAASSHSAALYVYILDHDFASNEHSPVSGSHHADELVLEFDNTVDLPDDYIFKKTNKTVMAPEEQPLSDKFVGILSAFAKTGNPNPSLKNALGEGDSKWPVYTTDSQTYLSLSHTPRVVQKAGPYRDRTALWVDLLPELSHLTSQLQETAPESSGKDQTGPEAKEEL